MSRDVLNIGLLAALVLSILANWVVGRDTTRPNYDILPNMAYSVPYDSFSENPNFADGKTLQAPPPGTLARDARPLYYDATPEDATRAGEELENPFQKEEDGILLKAADVYRIYCLPCHGGSGKGDGTVALRGYPPPPPLDGKNAVAMKDGRIFHLITFGQGNMPGYDGQMSQEERWQAVLHVRALQEKAARKAEVAAIAAAAQLEATASESAAIEPVAEEPAPIPEVAPQPVEEVVQEPALEVEAAVEPATQEETDVAPVVPVVEPATPEQAPAAEQAAPANESENSSGDNQ